MNNIVVRAISGAIYVGIIVASIVWGGKLAYPFVCALLAGAGIAEMNRLCNGTVHSKGEKTLLRMDIASGFCLATGFGLIFAYSFTAAMWCASILLLIGFGLLIARPVAQLFYPDINAIRSLMASFGSILYVVIPLICSSLIMNIFGAGILLALFIMIWCNDTGAFLTGVSCGRHKLWERISPKKTWEGFFGGMVFCTLAAVACFYLFSGHLSFNSETHIELWKVIILGITVSIVATWGDLVESLLKRTAGVKDSGHIIPGHGGVLDRIDSLLLVMPWGLLLLICMNIIY